MLAAARSKDFRTRNGACIASAHRKILGVGFNGLPRGCDDANVEYWLDNDRDPLRSRHSYVVHAELNAILNSVVNPLDGSSLYTTQHPCPRCAQAAIQVGIRSIIFLSSKSTQARAEAAARAMLADAGVTITSLADLDSAAAAQTAHIEVALSRI